MFRITKEVVVCSVQSSISSIIWEHKVTIPLLWKQLFLSPNIKSSSLRLLLPGDSTRQLCQAVMLPSRFNQVETRYIIQPLFYPFKDNKLIAVIIHRDCKGERQPLSLLNITWEKVSIIVGWCVFLPGPFADVLGCRVHHQRHSWLMMRRDSFLNVGGGGSGRKVNWRKQVRDLN